MRETLFISDLHLDPDRPDITRLFLDFLAQRASRSEGLYILGDLFEAWVGDDDDEPAYRDIQEALRAQAERGLPLYVMRGNRDFLLGRDFAEATGAVLLEEPALVDLYGEQTLLMHGDVLCTDDHSYQAFRRQVRNPLWQREFLAKPLAERKAMAQAMRMESATQTRQKEAAIMDVNPGAVEQAFLEHGIARLIHGHTHRPDVHQLTVGDRTVTRIVLGDWYTQGSVLSVTPEGHHLSVLPLDG